MWNYQVFLQGMVIGRMSPCDLCVACDRGFVGFDQLCLFFLECPVAIISEVAGLDPFTTFIWVSALRPVPEHLPLGMSDLREDILGRRVPVVVRPSPYNWVQERNDLHCRGLLMCVQVGSYPSQVFEHGLQPVILGACPWQSAPLNRLYCGLDTHFFASYDDGDCLAPPPWRSRATTCRQGTSRLFQDAARRLSFRSRQST